MKVQEGTQQWYHSKETFILFCIWGNDSQMILRVEVQKLRGFSWLESLAEIYENKEGTYAIYTFIFFR